MLFLIQFEHSEGFLTTHLVRAKDAPEAQKKVEDWLSEEYAGRDGEWHISSDGDGIRVQTMAKIQCLDDLPKWLPVIE